VTPRPSIRWLELARRTGSGVEVTLLRNEPGDRFKVALNDGRVCHHVDLELARGEGLGAFHYPFAHATARLHATPLDTQWDGGKNS
jgi:hypothetical protein